MRKLILAGALIGAFGFAAPALAGAGQCYDAYGRPVGPVYDTDHPNYGFINSVVRRGGNCTGVVSPPTRPGYRGYRSRYNDYDRSPRYNYRGDRRQRDNARRQRDNRYRSPPPVKVPFQVGPDCARNPNSCPSR